VQLERHQQQYEQEHERDAQRAGDRHVSVVREAAHRRASARIARSTSP